jgi:COPI associated protein
MRKKNICLTLQILRRSESNVHLLMTFFTSAVPRMILYTRIANLVLSICMIMVSLLSLLTTADATTGVLACYVMVFSCLLCCFETHLKQIAKIIALNFGFLYSAKSRSVFMMFVGTSNNQRSSYKLILSTDGELCLLQNT